MILYARRSWLTFAAFVATAVACTSTPDSSAPGPITSGSGGAAGMIASGGMGGIGGTSGIGGQGGTGGAPSGGAGGSPSMDGGPGPILDAGGTMDMDAQTTGGTGGSSGAGGAGGGSGDPSCEGGSQVDLALIGWAAESGGTTGGKGGATITVSDGAALVQALSDQQDSSTPLTIMVSGRITEANSGGATKLDVKDVRDVSIIGAGDGAELDGIGIKIVRASNIVIRNLRIHHVASGDKDAISIEGPADHIWIDHCELYADYQGVDKDFYDGLLDVKGDAEYITYSWNYLHDSWKTSLVGSSEDDTFDRKITMHHNRYENCNSRLPLFRGGNGHVFNNYYVDIADTGINSRLGGCLKIEANYFDNAKNPWVSAYSDELGGGELLCNVLSEDSVFEYASDVHELPTCSATVPYEYAAVLNHTDHVPAVVMDNAGVGKLTDPAQF
jgi:pectate lyase